MKFLIDECLSVRLTVLLANLDVIAEDLDKGAFVVFTEDRIRIRRLPLT